MAQAANNGQVITVGDEVELTAGFLKGEVKYVGELLGKQGTFYGIELKENKGKNDGTLDGHYYFKTKDKKGKFVLIGDIKSSKPGDLPRVTVGDKVKVLGKGDGTIRYIGTPKFKPGIWYGIELESPNGKNNGTVDKHQYFQCTDKHGSFVQVESLQLSEEQKPQSKPSSAKASNTTASSAKKTTKVEPKSTSTTTSTTTKPATTSKSTSTTTTSTSTTTDKTKKPKADDKLEVADKVVVKPDRKGQIKWIGEAKNFGVGTWYGVRLVEQKGICNGTFKDHKFFQCPDGYGIYVQRTLIVKKLDNNDPNANFDYMDEEKKYEKEKEEQFQQLKMEQDKLRQIKIKFQEIDTDGNRTIDLNEWLKMGKDVFSQLTEKQLKSIFRKIDLSGSNEISFAEFDGWISKIGGIDKIHEQADEDVSNEEKNDPSNDISNNQSSDNVDAENNDTTQETDANENADVDANDTANQENIPNEDAPSNDD